VPTPPPPPPKAKLGTGFVVLDNLHDKQILMNGETYLPTI